MSVSRSVCLSVCVCVCSVDSGLTVQITDTALSRDLFPRDYHCLGDNDNRPVKWLAIESLVDRRFTVASDTVLIYGDSCWHLFVTIFSPYSALTLLVGWQEGHLARKQLGVGFLMMTIWVEFCTSYSSSCHHSPPPSSLAPVVTTHHLHRLIAPVVTTHHVHHR